MKWAVYLISHKDTKKTRGDVFVGHLAYCKVDLGKTLEERLDTHMQLTEERGRRNEAGLKLRKRMISVGPENWEIKPLACASTNDEVVRLEKTYCTLLKPDLNQWVLP